VKGTYSKGSEVTDPRFGVDAEDQWNRHPRGRAIPSSVRREQQAIPQFIERTLKAWQPHTPKVLTLEDAREIVGNVTGFFEILMEWNAAERRTPANSEVHSKSRMHSATGRRTG